MASFTSMWADLEPVGRAPSGGYRRFALTREDHTLREWFAGEAAARGLEVVTDRAGNQWAWWNPGPEPGIAIGSHLENLERNDGYKGFNQQGVSEIITNTDPRKLATFVGA